MPRRKTHARKKSRILKKMRAGQVTAGVHAAEVAPVVPTLLHGERTQLVTSDGARTDVPNGHVLHKVYPGDRQQITDEFLKGWRKDELKREQKRRVHVIDDLDDMREASDVKYQETLRIVRELTPHAKRFIFDTQASTRIGHCIRDNINDVMDLRQFARPPYDVTYLQLDIDAVIRAIGQGSTADHTGWHGSKDLETAYLIHGRKVYPLARGKNAGGLSLFFYQMGEEGKLCTCRPLFFGEPMYADDKLDHVIRAMLLLGSSYNGMEKERWLNFIHSVYIDLNVGQEIYRDFTPSERERWNKRNWQMILSSAGDYRVMLTALWLLNQQKHVETIHVPNNSMLIGGKRKVIKQHHRVVIRLENFDVIRRTLGHKLLTPRVEHDVRGHLRNVHVLKGCAHEWTDLSDRHGIVRWTCSRCNGLRTTVRPHKRGDASVGKATSHYEVKE